MQKKLLVVLTILLVTLAFVSCSSKDSNGKTTKSSAKEVAKKFVGFSEGYKNPKNQNQIAAGVTMMQIYDDTLNDKAIEFGNDPLISKEMSLFCKMNIKGGEFSFDDYPMYKEAFEYIMEKTQRRLRI